MTRIVALTALIAMTAVAWAQDARFVDHGVGAPVAESRGLVTMTDAEGHRLALVLSTDCSPRGWILLIDVDSGETQQFYYPEGVPNSAPFASLLSRNGRFYTFAGKVLLEFDPLTREWLFSGIPARPRSVSPARRWWTVGRADLRRDLPELPPGLLRPGDSGDARLRAARRGRALRKLTRGR